MLGSCVFLSTAGSFAEELLVLGLYQTPLLSGLRIAGLVFDGRLCVDVSIVMSRRQLVAGALIKQRGLRDLAVAGHGEDWDGRWVQLAERA